MADRLREPEAHRVLVALDASPYSLAILESAAELAGDLHAELRGVFVEGTQFFKLAESQDSYKADNTSPLLSEPINRANVNQVFSVRPGQMERTMARLANQASVPWDFRVAHSASASELLAAASDVDLVVLGKAGGLGPGWQRPDSIARALMAETQSLTMIVQRGKKPRLPILVVYDGSEAAKRALAAARRLVGNKSDHLVVVILADTRQESIILQAEVNILLQSSGLYARYRRLLGAEVQDLNELIAREDGGLLVFPRQDSRLHNDMFLTILSDIICPLLLVRSNHRVEPADLSFVTKKRFSPSMGRGRPVHLLPFFILTRPGALLRSR